MTGSLRLDSVLEGTPPRKVEPPAQREECCLFAAYQWGGEPQAPIYRGNAEGAKFIRGLPHGYIAEKTSPGPLASGPEGTEETSTLLGKYEFCKALCMTLKGNELALLNEAIKRMR
ncbi:MAG: hypothetical protein R6T98_11470 [Desulfatiglandales bacterium]